VRTRVLLVPLVVAALLAPWAPAGAAGPRFREYVALGDSWSADVVIADLHGLPATTYAPLGCAQSHVNYPKLLARALKVPVFRDATCGSATTDDFYRPQTGLPTGGANPAQFSRLTKKTDLVTVGVGGNDAGFASAAVSCLNALPGNVPQLAPYTIIPFSIPFLGNRLPIGGCKERFVHDGRDELAERIRAAEPKLVRALREIHRRSPRARVLMVDYMDAIPTKACWPLVPITQTDMAYLRDTFDRLNALGERAARKGGADLVDTFAATHGHDVCRPPTDRYVEGLGVVSLNGLAVAVPAHPNSAGAAAQFRAVLDRLRR
jgi:hypothetical protein